MRQMLSATLNVYRWGPDTREARREIILDYLNTVPLAAVPGYGEINGLGSGLQAWFGVRLADVDRALTSPVSSHEKVTAFKEVLTLLGAVRAPSYYLLQNRKALEARVRYYTRLLAEVGLIDGQFARQLDQSSVRFAV
jgi:membrane peptidoglycan carboxypeptidase